MEQSGNLMGVEVGTCAHALQFGTPQLLFHTEPNFNGPHDVTAAGKKFLINNWGQNDGGEPVTRVLNWPAELKK